MAQPRQPGGRLLQEALAGDAGPLSTDQHATAGASAPLRRLMITTASPVRLSPTTTGLTPLQEEHMRVQAQYRELLEEIDAESRLRQRLRHEEELLRQEANAIREQQRSNEQTVLSLHEVLTHWARQKEAALERVAESQGIECSKRKELEARVKVLEERIESERRQAIEVDEFHRRLAQDIADVDDLLRQEAAMRIKFESKIGGSFEVLKKSASSRVLGKIGDKKDI